MNNVRTPLAFLLATAFALAGAQAHEPVTRAQVIAETREAARTGDLMAPGDSGMKLNELYPDRYPVAAPATAPRSRDEVLAELRAAIRSGDVLAAGDTGLKENELHPERYPANAVAAGKTRAQVRAETQEAIRVGDIVAAGESGLKLNEQFPRRYEQARALAVRQLATTAAASTACDPPSSRALGPGRERYTG